MISRSDLHDKSEVHQYVTAHCKHVVRTVIGCFTRVIFMCHML